MAGWYEKWLVEAKEAGYPLCPQCHEPLPKKLHGKKGALCPFCQRLEERIAEKSRVMRERSSAEWQ